MSRTDLLDQQVAELSESEAWKLIYELDALERAAKQPALDEICFTGFGASEKVSLTNLAIKVGFSVKDSVTTTLSLLCAGPSAGPAKLQKANKQGVKVLSVEEFHQLLRQIPNA